MTRPMNLTDPQSRRLITEKELLVVLPCEPQPDADPGKVTVETFRPAREDKFGDITEGPEIFGAVGEWWSEWGCKAPYKPGDVVPCRESCELCYTNGLGMDPFVRYGDGKEVCFQRFENQWRFNNQFVDWCDEIVELQRVWLVNRGYVAAGRMPTWAIRLRPVVSKVECRLVSSITGPEVYAAGYPFSSDLDQFNGDWPRRYRRRGESFEFGVAWGWFTTLVLKD